MNSRSLRMIILRVEEQEDPPGLRAFLGPHHWVVIRDADDAQWVRDTVARDGVCSIGLPFDTMVYSDLEREQTMFRAVLWPGV